MFRSFWNPIHRVSSSKYFWIILRYVLVYRFFNSKIFQSTRSWWISVERKIVKIISKLVFNSESKSKFEFWNLELFVGSVIIFVHKQTLYFQVLDFFKVEIRRGYSKSLQTLNSSNQSASKGCSCPRMIVSRLIS